MSDHIERAKLAILFAEEARRATADNNPTLAVACHRKRLAMACAESTLHSDDEAFRMELVEACLTAQFSYICNVTASQFIKDKPLFGKAPNAPNPSVASLLAAVAEGVERLGPRQEGLFRPREPPPPPLAARRNPPARQHDSPPRARHRPEELGPGSVAQGLAPPPTYGAKLDPPPLQSHLVVAAPPFAAAPFAAASRVAAPPPQPQRGAYGFVTAAPAAPLPVPQAVSAPPVQQAPPAPAYGTVPLRRVTNEADPAVAAPGGFVTAAQQYQADIKAGRAAPAPAKRLGLSRRQPFQAPFRGDDGAPDANAAVAPPPSSNRVTVDAVASSIVAPNGKQAKKSGAADAEGGDVSDFPEALLNPDGTIPARLENLDPKLVGQIASEILESNCNVTWDDIAGLEHAKSEVDEAIVWPLARPDLFQGLRDPPRGLLLFGPPGTGKTMIARAIASRGNCTFMAVSSSSLMSKWVGEGEKLVRCLFAVAAVKQPTVIFIDEIDSLLSMRSEGEMDAVRRVKTEFLVQLDGVGTSSDDRILIIGATNRPEELDEAARRRMEKRLYIPLPDLPARKALLKRLLLSQGLVHALTEEDFDAVALRSEGFSGADVRLLARDASLGPLREQGMAISSVSADSIRPVMRKDFVSALRRIKPSVGSSEIIRYETFNKDFGSFSGKREDGEDDEEFSVHE